MTWIAVFAAGAVLLSGLSILAGAEWEPQVKAARRRVARRFRRPGRPAAPYVPRHAESLPRRKPLAGRQPWQTAEFPALPVPEAQTALDPGDGLDEPPLARPYVADTAPDAFAWMRRDHFDGADVNQSVSAWRPDAVTAEGERLPQVIA